MEKILVVEGKIELFTFGYLFKDVIKGGQLMIAPPVLGKLEATKLAETFAANRPNFKIILAIDEDINQDQINSQIISKLNNYKNVVINWAKPDFEHIIFPDIVAKFKENNENIKRYINSNLTVLLNDVSRKQIINNSSYISNIKNEIYE
jgi:hypothetical protein